jgi:WD40 repeat protein
VKPRTVTIPPETYAEARRDRTNWQAKRARFIWHVIAPTTVLGGRSAWPQPPSDVWIVAWSPDGKRLAGSGNSIARVWDAETGKELLALGLRGPYLGFVPSVAWSPDGKRLATGSYGGKAKLWDAETGQELLTLSSHSGPVSSVAWSLDGKRLAAGSYCRTVKVWDTETGAELLKVEGFPGCEEMSDSGGPTVTLGIEINLPA